MKKILGISVASCLGLMLMLTVGCVVSEGVKNTLQKSYVTVNKTLMVINVVEEKLAGSDLYNDVGPYLSGLKESVLNIKQTLQLVSSLLGVTLTEVTSANVKDPELLLQELLKANEALKAEIQNQIK